MNAEAIAGVLGGRKAGATWMARCPAHDEISEVKGGRVLVRCHAGCEQRDVIAALRQRGVWEKISHDHFSPAVDCADNETLKRTKAALSIWQASDPVCGSLVETYLRSRGLLLPASTALRFHPRLKHPTGGALPAMVALVTHGTSGSSLAIHRTFLARDGFGKAPVDRPKMMLGPCHGGAVRLADLGKVLMVGEGIETCLAAMQATGQPAWAALSTSGLRSLVLPREVRDVIVLADGDKPGEAAAIDCARRWKREGRRVRIARPPQDTDFNDLLVGGASVMRDSLS